jgi:hypothetical protein
MRCRRSKFGCRGEASPYLVEILHNSADGEDSSAQAGASTLGTESKDNAHKNL